jgi:16S rRNA processing protein RimM
MLTGLEPAELPADAIEVGRIADAWGIKGWFKVLPYSADPEALFSSKRWFLLPTERGARPSPVSLRCPSRKPRNTPTPWLPPPMVWMTARLPRPCAAPAFLSHDPAFPAVAKDEYYWVDLIGLDVINREDVALGGVKELLSTGAQTVLVLEYQEDGMATCERMIPFVAAYVDDVDLKARRIRVDWQPTIEGPCVCALTSSRCFPELFAPFLDR